jgi:hypothetical protein
MAENGRPDPSAEPDKRFSAQSCGGCLSCNGKIGWGSRIHNQSTQYSKTTKTSSLQQLLLKIFFGQPADYLAASLNSDSNPPRLAQSPSVLARPWPSSWPTFRRFDGQDHDPGPVVIRCLLGLHPPSGPQMDQLNEQEYDQDGSLCGCGPHSKTHGRRPQTKIPTKDLQWLSVPHAQLQPVPLRNNSMAWSHFRRGKWANYPSKSFAWISQKHRLLLLTSSTIE